MIDRVKTITKGFVVGATMLVPGVSGGTTAIILGIYTRLVKAVADLRANFKASLMFLVLFAFGGGLGILIAARPLDHLVKTYTMPTMFFFMGVVLAGIPIMLREAKIKRDFHWSYLIYTAIGIGLIALMAIFKTDETSATMSANLGSILMLFAAGFIAAIALVLPGISFSYFMLLLGLYDEMLLAIKSLYLPFLIPLGIGLVVGILTTTKVLERLMDRYPTPTYLIIMGFMLGSLVQVFPGIPSGWDWPICATTLALGVLAIIGLSRLEGVKTSGRPKNTNTGLSRASSSAKKETTE